MYINNYLINFIENGPVIGTKPSRIWHVTTLPHPSVIVMKSCLYRTTSVYPNVQMVSRHDLCKQIGNPFSLVLPLNFYRIYRKIYIWRANNIHFQNYDLHLVEVLSSGQQIFIKFNGGNTKTIELKSDNDVTLFNITIEESVS